MPHDLLKDITFCIVAAWALGVLAQTLRQPVILAYLLGGFLLGPKAFKAVHSAESIEVISELGLIFLLFMIGLEIDLKKIMKAGRSITLTAAVQIVGGAILGLIFFRLCGFPLGGPKWDALYLAVAAAMSSTVIIVKVLYEKRELDTLTGRVTLGVLVLQDLFAILFLAVQPSLDRMKAMVLIESLGRVLVLVVTALAVSRWILPPVFRKVARLPELILVGALAWCFLVGELGARLQLSREMGALVAGVALSTFPYALEVTAKVTTLRDFFVTLFFVGLGMKIPIPDPSLIGWGLLFAAFVVASRFATTFVPLYRMKQGLRTSFLPALNLAQVSEFSLVILELGVKSNHIEASTSGMGALAFVLLAALSTMGMSHSDGIVRKVIPWLKRWGLEDLDDSHTQLLRRQELKQGGGGEHGDGASILVLGFFRTASSLLQDLQQRSPEILQQLAVVDFNPQVHAELKSRGIRAVYGDISQRDTLVHAGIEHAKVVICTIPDSLLKGTTNEKMVRQIRELNAHAQILAPAEVLGNVPALYAAGASYVSIPRLSEAAHLGDAVIAALEQRLDEKRFDTETQLRNRREVLP